MHKPSFNAFLALAATITSAQGLSAQSAIQPAPKVVATCTSGLSGGGPDCPLDRRLLIDVRRRGSGAPPELNAVVHLGASFAGVFQLSHEQATAADSALYAIVDVKRDVSGEYTVEQSISGPLVKRTENCRGYSTGKLDDLTFGAYLATVTTGLVRCAQQGRPHNASVLAEPRR